MKKEALLYERLENKSVHCYLCAHQCRITDNQFGFCGVRQNLDGSLYTYTYGRLVAAHVDPIEKKPLYHFLPGSSSFSVATIGCNFRCGFCQNWEISQGSFKEGDNLSGENVSVGEIVESALKNKCKSISYTYTEPTIFFEYALDIAKSAKEKGLYNIFVTNGYMNPEAIQMVQPYLDAANIDLKFFNESSYKKICGGKLGPVLNSIRLMRKLGIWVEVTTLVVPGENDSQEQISGIAQFIAGVDKDTPWHISRFHPDYKFGSYPSTPEEALKRAQEIGYKYGLRYIYVGNVSGWGNDTLCHNCKKLLIRREALSVLDMKIKNGKCPYCQSVIPGVLK